MKNKIDRLNKEVQIANEKAIELLSQLENVMCSMSNGYDTRFEQLLEKVIEGGGAYGGFKQNWKDGLHALKMEMHTELMSQDDSSF
jgi:translation elongation factor EF-G